MKSLLGSRRLVTVFAILAALSALVVSGSYLLHGAHGGARPGDSTGATPLKVSNSAAPPNDFVRIAKLVGPAVVNINTQTLPKQATNRNRRFHGQPSPQNHGNDNPDDNQQGTDNFQNFFNRFFGGQAPAPDDSDNNGQVQESLGSGFIVDPKGYIVTNQHVIDKADKIYVKLATDPDTVDQGRPARVIGFDKATDLAVIKIETNTPLPTVKLGNSDLVQVGDWVEAIGSPFELAQTVTAGIISAKNRTIDQGAPGQFQHFLQTDAAINPGNSGGPLLNMNGEVIGVNTAIYTESQGYQGIGFAMPSNTVVAVYNELIGPSHKVTRGSIGIQFKQGLSSSVNRVYGFKNGVIVTEVQAGGPADQAGIKPRDIITTIDGHSIKDGDDMVNEISGRLPGTPLRLGFLRDGKQVDTTVTVGDRDKIFAEVASATPDSNPFKGSGTAESRLGLTVQEIPAAIEEKLHFFGVRIQSVAPGSFADLEGLESGLVITRVNRLPVASKEQFEAVAGKLKSGDDVVFEIIDPKHPEQGIDYVGGTL
jgi:serine protease Do